MLCDVERRSVRASLPVREGLRDELDDTIDSARLLRVPSLLRSFLSFSELSLLPEILDHMLTAWVVERCRGRLQNYVLGCRNSGRRGYACWVSNRTGKSRHFVRS